MKDWFYQYFVEIDLTFLIICLILFALHSMHKADAGGSDVVLITWSTNTATGLIGVLTGIILGIILKKTGVTVNGKTDTPAPIPNLQSQQENK